MAESRVPPTDPLLQEVIDRLRAPVALNGAVEQALAEVARAGHRRRQRRTMIQITALAASVAVAALGMGWFRQERRATPGVTFALSAPGAAKVFLIGDFNDWDPGRNPLRRQENHWAVTLRLKPGRYRYSFVVDGSSWRADPRMPAAEDEFGTPTSVITVAR